MTTASPSRVVANRYDFAYLFDVTDGNPNGDPDMDNAPRFDPETFQGLVSDVCLKRKIRDYVHALKSQDGAIKPGYDIFVMPHHSLESRQRMPYDNLEELRGKAKAAKTDRTSQQKARDWMCQNFFDVRAFGAVMSTTDFNCGQVRGPIQLTFARSIDRIFSSDHAITRVAYTTEKKAQSTAATTEIGHKHTVAYGLYRVHGFVNAHLATDTGFTEADLDVLWQALGNMFDLDRSAARGEMACRGLWVFRHGSPLGNAPARALFDRIHLQCREGVESPRQFSDYEVGVHDKDLPDGIELLKVS